MAVFVAFSFAGTASVQIWHVLTVRPKAGARRRTRDVTMEMPATRAEPGARWLRCDLHVHTPFDREMKFGEDIKGAIDALKKAKPERLAQIADRFVQGCRNAANGECLRTPHDALTATAQNAAPAGSRQWRRLKKSAGKLRRKAHRVHEVG